MIISTHTVFMKTFLSSLIFFLFSISSFATTTTWNGGFGFWHQAGNWDTGQVPGEDDEVIITGGFVVIASNTTARAESVVVNPNSTFFINLNGTLRIADEFNVIGVTNRGFMFVSGTLELENLQASFNTSSARGVLNEHFFRVFNNGSITADNIKNITIKNAENATFINEGNISMNLQNSAWNTGIHNSGIFDNNLNGIIVQKGGYYGLDNITNSIRFHNRGKILISSTEAAGFTNRGFVRNFTTGSISMYKSTITNHGVDADFRNEGSISIHETIGSPALYNLSVFENEGWLNISDCSTGIYSYSPSSNYSPIFENSGYLSITSSVEAIFTEHDFINSADGYIIVDARINSSANGVFRNNGIFKVKVNSYYSPDFINNGILEDTYGKFAGTLTNNKVIVRPIPGPLFSGQPISPALDIASFAGITFGNWQDDLGGNFCGTFSLATNTLIPNQFAQQDNDNAIWVHLGISGVGNDDWFEVVVDNSLPLQAETSNMLPDNLYAFENTSLPLNEQFEITTYPNPTFGPLTVSIKQVRDVNLSLKIMDASGQLLDERILSAGSLAHQLDITDWPVGVYFIQMGGKIQRLVKQ